MPWNTLLTGAVRYCARTAIESKTKFWTDRWNLVQRAMVNVYLQFTVACFRRHIPEGFIVAWQLIFLLNSMAMQTHNYETWADSGCSSYCCLVGHSQKSVNFSYSMLRLLLYNQLHFQAITQRQGPRTWNTFGAKWMQPNEVLMVEAKLAAIIIGSKWPMRPMICNTHNCGARQEPR